jgi:hypothetical protein
MDPETTTLHDINDQQRILRILAKAPRDWQGIATATRLPRGALSRALFALTSSDHSAPAVNRVNQGNRCLYQLSPLGRKMLNVTESSQNNVLHTQTTTAPAVHLAAESYKSKIFKALKDHGPQTAPPLAKVAGTSTVNTVYHLKGLMKKGMVKRLSRGLYAVADQVQAKLDVIEPPKPVLTGAVPFPLPSPELRQWLKSLMREALIEAGHVLNQKPETEAKAKLPQPKLPRVLLIGGLPQQQQIIEKEFEGFLDLRFAKDDNDLEGRIGNAEYIVAWVRFMGHSQDAIAKAANIPYYPVNGGITSIKETLEGIWYDATKETA